MQGAVKDLSEKSHIIANPMAAGHESGRELTAFKTLEMCWIRFGRDDAGAS